MGEFSEVPVSLSRRLLRPAAEAGWLVRASIDVRATGTDSHRRRARSPSLAPSDRLDDSRCPLLTLSGRRPDEVERVRKLYFANRICWI